MPKRRLTEAHGFVSKPVQHPLKHHDLKNQI